MTFAQLEARFDANAEKIVAKHAQTFHSDIKFAWPVDTSFSKRQWFIRKDGDTWKVFNNAAYSGILWLGRIGKQGSDQMPAGGNPILSANIQRLRYDLKANLL